MIDPSHVDALLEEVDEEYEALGYLGLHDFSWSLRGLDLDLTDEAFRATARAAYEEFRRRTPTTLVWLSWPSADPDEAVPADESAEPELDMDPDGPVRPFLALIPVT